MSLHQAKNQLHSELQGSINWIKKLIKNHDAARIRIARKVTHNTREECAREAAAMIETFNQELVKATTRYCDLKSTNLDLLGNRIIQVYDDQQRARWIEEVVKKHLRESKKGKK